MLGSIAGCEELPFSGRTCSDIHFLLQCVKVKSESQVAQSCPTLCDPMDCSPPGSSAHGAIKEKLVLPISEGRARDDWRCNLTQVFGYALQVSPL